MSWIMTSTGKHFDLLNPRCTDICITDIATGLSNICRFTGQLPAFYSVAQHCVMASYLVPQRYAFEALMHDAQEAYISDVSTPLKQLLPEYKRIEQRIERTIRTTFDLPFAMSPEVKQADRQMLCNERHWFGLDDGTPWTILEGFTPTDLGINPLTPEQAKRAFLERFVELLP